MDNRDYFWDNLKAFLMVLVIFGHTVTSLREVKEITGLYYFVYTFHMPLFVFTSGFMAKTIMRDGKFRADRFFSTLWLYFFFCAGKFVIARVLGQQVGLHLLDISGAPWYLLALLEWYLLVPLLLSLKPKMGMIFSVLTGLFAGYFGGVGTYLTLSRTLVFLPFFALGLYLPKEKLYGFLDKTKKLRLPAIIFLAGMAIYFMFFGDSFFRIGKLVFANRPYRYVLEELAPYGFLFRGGLYLLAVILCVSVMLFIPHKKAWFSYVGKYSLSVYILHVFVRDIMKHTGVFHWIKGLREEFMWLVIPACVIAALILGNPIFGRVMNWIANPVREWRNHRKDKLII